MACGGTGTSVAAVPTVEVAAPTLGSVEPAVAEATVEAYVSALVEGDRQAAVARMDASHFLGLGLGGQSVPEAAFAQAQAQGTVGGAVVQSVDTAATDLYAGLRYQDAKAAGAGLNGVVTLVIGARIKF